MFLKQINFFSQQIHSTEGLATPSASRWCIEHETHPVLGNANTNAKGDAISVWPGRKSCFVSPPLSWVISFYFPAHSWQNGVSDSSGICYKTRCNCMLSYTLACLTKSWFFVLVTMHNAEKTRRDVTCWWCQRHFHQPLFSAETETGVFTPSWIEVEQQEKWEVSMSCFGNQSNA